MYISFTTKLYIHTDFMYAVLSAKPEGPGYRDSVQFVGLVVASAEHFWMKVRGRETESGAEA